MDKASGQLVRRTLAEGLGLTDGLSDYVTFRDYVTHLEYIRSCRELAEKGLYVELGGYQCHAFLDLRFVSGDQWAQVCAALNGAGVSSVQAMFDEMFVTKEEVSGEKAKGKRKPAAKKSRKKPATGTKRKSPSTKVPKFRK
jgi:hypothetical protein